MPTDRNEYMREYMRKRRAKLAGVNPGTPPTPSVAASTSSTNEPIQIDMYGWWLVVGIVSIGVCALCAILMTPSHKRANVAYTLAKSVQEMNDTNATNDAA